jgi:folate-binding protein YgfZ
MPQPQALILDDRGVLAVEGPDGRSFLQGLVSNDVEKVSAERAIWAALLTPQGKFLHEFFIFNPEPEVLLLDCEAVRLADLKKRLSLYKLRSKVTVRDASDSFFVAALFGEGALDRLGLPAEPGRTAPLAGGRVAVDPRLAGLGARAMMVKPEGAAALDLPGFDPAERADYDRLRISLGVPDGSRDLQVDKAILLENGFDELHGIDWDKGCFMGQELTARTRYRGLVKKRLLPVRFDGPAPAPGSQVTCEGKDAGMLCSSIGDRGLALLRLERLNGPLVACGTVLTPQRPDWITLPERA